jgi:threonine aldolase
LKIDPKILCQGIDAMQFSLCKGLCAPVGCLLLGTKEFIQRSRRIRQRIGGGMAQAGHMAAAGIVALETMIGRLQDDHVNANRLARGLANCNEHIVDVEKTVTNIVNVDLTRVGKSAFYLASALQEQSIKIKVIDSTTCRLVTHHDITASDIDETIKAIKTILG